MIKKIVIDSILGGITPATHFARSDQFRFCMGIDPALPISDASSIEGPCGLLRPTGFDTISTSFSNAVMWMIQNPKNNLTYLYDASGSTWTQTGAVVAALSDGGSMTNGAGNGSDYYDNYLYFAKNTTIARYGPLDGAAVFDGDYWSTTLGLAPLTNPTYPLIQNITATPPPLQNHVMHRHSDGKLYFADVQSNQGVLSYIRTTKAAVEGDTNNGSTSIALIIGYGLYITAIESYGSNLVFACFEAGAAFNANSRGKAKLFIWDTVSVNFNQVVFEEFPDTIITGLKNINGVLYIASGNHTLGASTPGFRISQYIGGYSIKEVGYWEHGYPPYPSGLDGNANRLLIGSSSNFTYNSGCVYSLGLQSAALGQGLFGVMQVKQGLSVATALCMSTDGSLVRNQPMVAWKSLASGSGLDYPGTTYNNSLNPQMWQSQMFRIGQPFRILGMRVPFGQAMAANMTVIPTICVDDNSTNYTGNLTGALGNTVLTPSLPTFNNTTFPSGERLANINISGVEGYQNFYLDFKWSGSALLTINLPIIIYVETIDDN